MLKVLVANRGEIATRIFRACTELGIQTVAIYAKEDRFSVHRFKADEAYLVDTNQKPIDAYLNIEAILAIAKKAGVDAIHPGYGLLSENLDFAKACQAAGLTFIGPKLEHLDIFGDKIKAKQAALAAGLRGIPGSDGPVTLAEAYAFGDDVGYPIMVKAALGGGGRGMRVATTKDDLEEAFLRAKSEAKSAFGEDDVYVEKYVQNPKHIEVQILGDTHGNILHLFERDCSVQRRHQKVVEVAPAFALSDDLRQRICNAAVKLMKNVGYVNAGTVEFLVSGDDFYFIEVNPRVQVEHTVTEMITGVDIVESQLQIAAGKDLFKDLHLPHQDELKVQGYAIQCRITTEDPLNGFLPDTGRLMTYRSPGGFGIRLDVGNAYAGSVVTPYFDSLLVKVTIFSNSFADTVRKATRALKEFRIRGVKTNIPFLENVLRHPHFLDGQFKTTFIDETPELFIFNPVRDRGSKTLNYIGDVTVNGFPGIERETKRHFSPAPLPHDLVPQHVQSAKDVLNTAGAAGLTAWIKAQPKVLVTDTTMRDAHQSLLATRLRTKDLLAIAPAMEAGLPQLFSLEMWGGATFDVAYRFLNEDPWQRLRKLRKAMPHTLLQMLIRGANAVGYKNYPTNVLEAFIQKSADNGIDVFRIFDSLNWLPQMLPSIAAVKKTGKIAEVALCYTGDINDPTRTNYTLDYYVNLAKEIEAAGADILAIKDMAGLLKPRAARTLITALKEAVDLPIHLHTHDTSGNALLTYNEAIKAGVDIVDVAFSPLAGGTSQPSLTSLYYALEGSSRQPDFEIANAEQINAYYEGVRTYYHAFDDGFQYPHTQIYHHEMPGGQYSNLRQQAKSVGLLDRFEEVTDMYQRVNAMFGDIIKVTPSSKVVGDMALFMLKNNLTPENIYEHDHLQFPKSVIDFFRGDLGQPPFGFPQKLQHFILNGITPITVPPATLQAPVDFAQVTAELAEKMTVAPTPEDVLSYLLYPEVFLQYLKTAAVTDNISLLDTPTFFYGMNQGEEIEVTIERGKTLMIRLDEVGEADSKGRRVLYYNLNGQRREIKIKDRALNVTVKNRAKAHAGVAGEVGATMPGSILEVGVKVGDHVKLGQVILVTEAMKMETSLKAPFDGVVESVLVDAGDLIETGDLLLVLKAH